MGMIDLNVKKMTGPVIRLHPSDNVVVARIDVGMGMEIPSEALPVVAKFHQATKLLHAILRRVKPFSNTTCVLVLLRSISRRELTCTHTT